MAAFQSLKIPLGQDGEVFAALDLGTGNASCYIGRLLMGGGLGADFPATDVPGAAQTASQGVGPSGMVELTADAPLDTAISRAAKMVGERPLRAIASVGGTALTCRKVAVDLAIEGHTILEEDVSACLKEGARQAATPDCQPLHIWPTGYIIDGQNRVTDPRGLAGEILSVELTSLNAPKALLRSITDAMMRAQLDVSDFLAAPYAAGIATLLDDEMQLGALCLDMGAKTTSFAVFENNVLHAAGVVPVGGAHITSDIAKAFSMPIEDAERLKVLNGTAMIEPGAEELSWQTGTLSPYRESQEVTLPNLAQVIAPRLEETLEMVRDKLAAIGMPTGINRVVITGGASQIGGAVEMAEKVLGMKGRSGKLLQSYGAPEAASGPAFAVCAGLMDHVGAGLKIQAALNDAGKGRYPGVMRRMLNSPVKATGTGGRIGTIQNWLRDRF